MKYNSFNDYVQEITSREEAVKKLKSEISDLKKIINEVALEHESEFTHEYLSYLKYDIDFPLGNITVFKTNVEEEFAAQCRVCGKWFNVRIKSRQAYKDLQKFGATCPECERSWKVRNEIQGRQRQAEAEKYYHELRTMPYKDYLQTDHWKEFRKRVIRRYDGKCQICGKAGNVQVHHNNYNNRGRESYTDVILLCADCHKKHHNIKEV